jgi:hypothetical protein
MRGPPVRACSTRTVALNGLTMPVTLRAAKAAAAGAMGTVSLLTKV